jgi:hypothetical protein
MRNAHERYYCIEAELDLMNVLLDELLTSEARSTQMPSSFPLHHISLVDFAVVLRRVNKSWAIESPYLLLIAMRI